MDDSSVSSLVLPYTLRLISETITSNKPWLNNSQSFTVGESGIALFGLPIDSRSVDDDGTKGSSGS